MASPDLLSKICDELDARLRELRPAVDEYESLLDAAAALELDQGTARGSSTASGSSLREASSPRRASGSREAPSPRRASGSRAASRPTPRRPIRPVRKAAAAPKRARRGAAAVAILAALEHGSHTVSELAVVTAMSGAIINNNLRRLQQAGTITRAKRAGDGKAAYALTATPV